MNENLINCICSGLNYGLKAQVYSYWEDEYYTKIITGINIENNEILVDLPGGTCEIENVKPYLRKLSSITKEEEDWLFNNSNKNWNDALDFEIQSELEGEHNKINVLKYLAEFVDVQWLSKKHFDIFGLIDLGLALEAPDEMYKI